MVFIFLLMAMTLVTAHDSYTLLGETVHKTPIISISPKYLSAWQQFVSIYPTVSPKREEQWNASETISLGDTDKDVETFLDKL